jgi:hypothetical protein
MANNANIIHKLPLNGIKNQFIEKYSKHDKYVEEFLRDEQSGSEHDLTNKIKEKSDLYFLAKICVLFALMTME